jgi:hypothetical protein
MNTTKSYISPEHRQLAEKYNAQIIDGKNLGDPAKYKLTINGDRFVIWYTSYSRGQIPWAVARLEKIPAGEQGAGQDMHTDHTYHATLENAFKHCYLTAPDPQ